MTGHVAPEYPPSEAAIHQAMDDMPCIPVVEPEGDECGQMVIVYPTDPSKPFQRLPLSHFGAGIASGALQIGEMKYLDGSRSWPAWMWDSSKVPQILLPRGWA